MSSIVKQGTVNGYIVDAWSGERSEREFHYKITEHDKAKEPYSSKYSIEILDGVTGYESFYLNKYSMPHYTDPGNEIYSKDWCACGGTPKRWHQMWVYNKDMMEALKERIEEWKKQPWEGEEVADRKI
jgi:hypothetical protein